MKKLLLIDIPKQITFRFNIVFLGIYFLRVTNGDISKVALFYLLWYLFHPIFMYFVSKRLNKNNVISIFRKAVLLNFICFAILLFLKEKVESYILPLAILMALEEAIYYIPKYMLTYNVNKNGEFKKYLSYERIISRVVVIVTTFLTGYFIVLESYTLVFLIITILGFLTYLYTFKLDKIEFEQSELDNKKMKELLQDKNVRRAQNMNICDGLTAARRFNCLDSIINYPAVWF